MDAGSILLGLDLDPEPGLADNGDLEHDLQALLEVKAAAGEAALQVTDLAMRTGGGASFGRRLTVERNFRDARACSVMAPTTDVLYDLIARLLLEMPLF